MRCRSQNFWVIQRSFVIEVVKLITNNYGFIDQDCVKKVKQMRPEQGGELTCVRDCCHDVVVVFVC